MADAIRYGDLLPATATEVPIEVVASTPQAPDVLGRVQARSEQIAEQAVTTGAEILRDVQRSGSRILHEVQTGGARILHEVQDGSTRVAQEVQHNADYLQRQVRSYHRNRPLQAVQAAAAGAFAFGLILGLWRR